MDLDSFRDQFDIDESCFRGLADLPPGDQQIVMDVVETKGPSNPSAFTWSLVRKMKDPLAAGGQKLEYLNRRIDDKCKESLGRLPRSAQEKVASLVDISTCRNLSAFVFSQIKAVQSNPNLAPARGSVAAPTSKPSMGPPSFRPAPSLQMSAAVDRGRSRSPFGASLSTMSTEGLLQQMHAIQDELASRDRQATPRGGPGGAGLQVDAQDFAMRVGLDDSARKALSELDAEGQRLAVYQVEKQAARNPSAVTWSAVKRVRERRSEVKGEFIRSCLDDGAAAAFDKLHPDDQHQLMLTVDLAHVRNVSAVVWSKIRKGEFGDGMTPAPKAAGRPGSAPPRQSSFASSGGGGYSIDLDSRCSTALSELPEDLQDRILNEIPPDCRNPSAFVWSKVKALKTEPPEVVLPPPPDDDTLQTFEGYNLDKQCSAELGLLPFEVQDRILGEVPAECRNVSAFVW
eukprot:CAMPEP_0197657330 /NCGR_PEP_ID=MMETSP1338-20131121/44561_1 /TAXON_ID=43686 ORGANISM="Pelagodinium beii, Strain RCC1491" /NCGR_SAMPLE_ID=MMETSP1338 /ASSEMBLY_ACC=CAM_ASM_000754 /LENGTH=456 /DNA_ID=CAMNT_0043233677 /DNA_START=54 /DNA_END=1421 /DNA_ORIENTATION=+